MELAIQEAITGANGNLGGPFGAAIVKDGEVIATGYNTVISTKDVTNHAEIVAIRNACQKLGELNLFQKLVFAGTYDLSGCQIYASCHPCPMCLGACLWSRFDIIYYAADLKEAAQEGFDSNWVYDFWRNMSSERVKFEQVKVDDYLRPFNWWKESERTI